MKRAHVLALEIAKQFDMTAAPKEIRIVCIAQVACWASFDDDRAAEFVDNELAVIVAKLEAIEQEHLNKRTVCRYAFSSAGGHLIQGLAYNDPGVDSTMLAARRARLATVAWLEHTNQMTPRQFEQLCRGILAIVGCADPEVTRSSRDQGIDFFGKLRLEGRLANMNHFPSIDSSMDVWIVGQAKHIDTTRVSTPEVRALIGSVALARAKVHSIGGDTLRGFTPRLMDPIFLALFTTGEFSRECQDLLDKSGVLSLDGVQLAVFLCDNNIGLNNDFEFDDETATLWIDSFSD